MTSTVLRNALLFTPHGRREGDLRIVDGRIDDIGNVAAGDTEVDLEGFWIWPGAVDAHVHFRDPGSTHKEDFTTGSAAAVAGGVTTVLDMPNTSPTTTSCERLDAKRQLISGRTHCNFGLFFGANPDNLDEANRATNIAGLKIFMGCSTGDLLVYREDDLDRIFAGYDRKICVHAESELRLREREALFAHRNDPAVHSDIRDPEAAAEAVQLAAKLAKSYDRKLHILHLSTHLELDTLAEIGGNVTAEVCPHHLFWDTTAYEEWGNFARMNPPLRDARDREAMWKALHDGRIQMIATDHAPHTIAEKTRPYRQSPSGVPGVQTMLPLMLDAAANGQCTYEQVLEWLCHAPARIYSISQRHRLETGFWADLVVIDPTEEHHVRDAEQRSKCGWSPWRDRCLRGWPVMTFVNGNLVWEWDPSDDADNALSRSSRPSGTEVHFELDAI